MGIKILNSCLYFLRFLWVLNKVWPWLNYPFFAFPCHHLPSISTYDYRQIKALQLSEAISLIHTKKLNHQGSVTWADLGCGSGLFTEALASFLPPKSLIYAIDKDISALKSRSIIHKTRIKSVEFDFLLNDLNLKNLDGILMANAFHFVKDKITFLEKLNTCFMYDPVFLIVEYDTDNQNPWVPYPISFTSLKSFFSNLGYKSISKINEISSRYNTGNLYSALVTK